MLDRDLYKTMQKLLAKHGLSKVIIHAAEAQSDMEMLADTQAAQKALKEKLSGRLDAAHPVEFNEPTE